MAPRLTKAAADSKAAVDRASESLRARRMAIESAKLEALIETLGACVRTSVLHYNVLRWSPSKRLTAGCL